MRWCPSKVACGSLLAALCILSYWNSLSGDLLHDDIFAIRDNKDIRTDTPLSQLFHNDFWGKSMADPTSHKSYRPLTILSFKANYVMHGLNPFGYHIVNVILHMTCTQLVYVLGERVIFATGTSLSLQTASLFAVHPIHTEAVRVIRLID